MLRNSNRFARFTPACSLQRACLVAILISLSASLAHAQTDTRAKISAQLNVTALQPGKPAVIAVVIDVTDGFHAQSHEPKNDAIPTVVTLDDNPNFTASAPIYPPGKDETYPNLGTLNVFVGKTVIYIPIDVKTDAKTGAIEIKGSVNYQICDKDVCYQPETQSISIATKIAAASEKVARVNDALFAGYDANAAKGKLMPATSRSAVAPAISIDDGTPKWGVALALLAAFVAGILFNIVPCVLPVLPIKVLGFAEVAQHDRAKTLVLSSVFGLGIVTVFAVLAVLILGLKTITWGQQFSNPFFAWGIVVVLLILSFWLFGFLNVNLPTGVYRFSPRHDTMFGNYLWGILTAILSTPCTGPLFPPLLLWAQGQPTFVGVPAMMMVGVGMAFPYILLSAFPEAARKFPRVGPWAELFKQMLGFILLAFTVYFAASRFAEHGEQWWAIVPVAFLASLYLIARTVQLSKEARPVVIAGIFATVVLCGSILLACRFTGVLDRNESAGGSSNSSAVDWTPYSDSALKAARDAGKVVLVKFTANWCLNCQYIDATVFHDSRAIAALKQHDVVLLKADLTANDAPGWPRLRDIIASGGIPLTAIYAPGYDKPFQLASVYTTDTLIKAIEQLDGAKTKVAADEHR